MQFAERGERNDAFSSSSSSACKLFRDVGENPYITGNQLWMLHHLVTTIDRLVVPRNAMRLHLEVLLRQLHFGFYSQDLLVLVQLLVQTTFKI